MKLTGKVLVPVRRDSDSDSGDMLLYGRLLGRDADKMYAECCVCKATEAKSVSREMSDNIHLQTRLFLI